MEVGSSDLYVWSSWHVGQGILTWKVGGFGSPPNTSPYESECSHKENAAHEEVLAKMLLLIWGHLFLITQHPL